MKATIKILPLIALTPLVASAHTGHVGHEASVFGLPLETIEWLVIAATVAVVIKIFSLRRLERQTILNRRPDQRK